MSTIPKEPTQEEKQEMILALKFLFEQWGKDYTDKSHPCYYTAPNTVALLMVRYQLATDGREQERNKAQIGSDEYWNKLDQNFGKTQEYHYKGEKCVAGCKNFS